VGDEERFDCGDQNGHDDHDAKNAVEKTPGDQIQECLTRSTRDGGYLGGGLPLEGDGRATSGRAADVGGDPSMVRTLQNGHAHTQPLCARCSRVETDPVVRDGDTHAPLADWDCDYATASGWAGVVDAVYKRLQRRCDESFGDWRRYCYVLGSGEVKLREVAERFEVVR
jgi:hypothetical protein